MSKTAKIASKFAHYYVLIHFHDESNFSVYKLKDAVTPASLFFMDESNDLTSWDPSTDVQCMFEQQVYPAKFLQFGCEYYFNYRFCFNYFVLNIRI